MGCPLFGCFAMDQRQKAGCVDMARPMFSWNQRESQPPPNLVLLLEWSPVAVATHHLVMGDVERYSTAIAPMPTNGRANLQSQKKAFTFGNSSVWDGRPNELVHTHQQNMNIGLERILPSTYLKRWHGVMQKKQTKISLQRRLVFYHNVQGYYRNAKYPLLGVQWSQTTKNVTHLPQSTDNDIMVNKLKCLLPHKRNFNVALIRGGGRYIFFLWCISVPFIPPFGILFGLAFSLQHTNWSFFGGRTQWKLKRLAFLNEQVPLI